MYKNLGRYGSRLERGQVLPFVAISLVLAVLVGIVLVDLIGTTIAQADDEATLVSTPSVTLVSTDTQEPPTATLVSTDTQEPPTATLVPTDTQEPPTATLLPTDTQEPPTATLVPTDTPEPVNEPECQTACRKWNAITAEINIFNGVKSYPQVVLRIAPFGEQVGYCIVYEVYADGSPASCVLSEAEGQDLCGREPIHCFYDLAVFMSGVPHEWLAYNGSFSPGAVSTLSNTELGMLFQGNFDRRYTPATAYDCYTDYLVERINGWYPDDPALVQEKIAVKVGNAAEMGRRAIGFFSVPTEWGADSLGRRGTSALLVAVNPGFVPGDGYWFCE